MTETIREYVTESWTTDPALLVGDEYVYYSDPIYVPHDDGSGHWETLSIRTQYDVRVLSEKEGKIFSKLNKKDKKKIKDKDNKDVWVPYHTFGRSTNDPDNPG